MNIISFSISKWLFHVQKLFSEIFIYRSVYLLLENALLLLLCKLEGTQLILGPPRTVKIKIISIIFHLRLPALQSKFGLQCITFSKSPSTCNKHLLATFISMYLWKGWENTEAIKTQATTKALPLYFRVCGLGAMSSEISCGDLLGTSWLVLTRELNVSISCALVPP